jgi:hypothetical protein
MSPYATGGSKRPLKLTLFRDLFPPAADKDKVISHALAARLRQIAAWKRPGVALFALLTVFNDLALFFLAVGLGHFLAVALHAALYFGGFLLGCSLCHGKGSGNKKRHHGHEDQKFLHHGTPSIRGYVTSFQSTLDEAKKTFLAGMSGSPGAMGQPHGVKTREIAKERLLVIRGNRQLHAAACKPFHESFPVPLSWKREPGSRGA